MTDQEANEIRLIANEIMRKLFVAKQREQLDILRWYATRAIEEIDKAALRREGSDESIREKN